MNLNIETFICSIFQSWMSMFSMNIEPFMRVIFFTHEKLNAITKCYAFCCRYSSSRKVPSTRAAIWIKLDNMERGLTSALRYRFVLIGNEIIHYSIRFSTKSPCGTINRPFLTKHQPLHHHVNSTSQVHTATVQRNIRRIKSKHSWKSYGLLKRIILISASSFASICKAAASTVITS